MGFCSLCSFNSGLKRPCVGVTHQSTRPQQQSWDFIQVDKLFLKLTLAWKPTALSPLCANWDFREMCRLYDQGRYSHPDDGSNRYETWLKICQTIGRIYHETSYLHCHPRRSSDLRQTARTPDLPATTLTDLYRGTAYVDTKGIQLRMVFRAVTSVGLERETMTCHNALICTFSHSVRQCKYGSTDAECLAWSSVTESVCRSYERDSWI
jgi:hypothetical protein